MGLITAHCYLFTDYVHFVRFPSYKKKGQKLVFQWTKPLQLALCCPSCPELSYWHACSFLKCHIDLTLIYTLPYPNFSIIIITCIALVGLPNALKNSAKPFLTWFIKYGSNMWMATSFFFFFGGVYNKRVGSKFPIKVLFHEMIEHS